MTTLHPSFTTPEMAAVFSAEAHVRALLRFEAALAGALADAGIAPPAAAETIAAVCADPGDDPGAMLAATFEVGTPLLPLVELIRSRVDDEAAQWVHHGATTQDAVDTAHMLQAGDGLALLEASLVDVATRARELAVAHRDHAQLGRTFLQDAAPTTFGFRTLTWLAGVVEHVARLRTAAEQRAVQLGGVVGDLGPYGARGTEVRAALAARLGLLSPDVAWHTDRTRIRDLAGTVASSTATAAKVAADLALLAQSDIGEVRMRTGASSAVPGKTNPIDATRALAAAAVCRGALGMLTAQAPHELDRAVAAWHVEWVALPLLFQAAAGTHEAVARALDTLEVDTARMAARVGWDPELDGRQFEAVLARYDEVVG